LTGRFRRPEDLPADDGRWQNPRFQDQNFTANLVLADRIRELSEAKGCTPSQLALAWLLDQASDIIPIPGTRRRARLEENAASVDLRLTSDERTALTEELPKASGDRYPAAGMTTVNR
jgi:aryl-alcohol dehydrogenase-like predicted oxidoreductase